MIEKIIENWKKAQDAGAWLPCPRCGNLSMREETVTNALSRRADIYICSECGTQEAIEDMRAKGMVDAQKELRKWFATKTVYALPDTRCSCIDEFTIDVSREVKLTKENIDDIMASALEGGITYWCKKAVVVDDYLGEYASEQISRGGTLRLYDSEEDEVYELTLEKFLNGFALACRKGYGEDWIDGIDVDTCQIDAIGADTIVQLALFGEVQFG